MVAMILLPFCGFQFTPLHERQQKKGDVRDDHCEFQFTPLHERQRHRRVH